MRAHPDPKYFDSPTVSVPELERLLRAKAVLLPGVKVTLHVEKGGTWKAKTWSYPGGLQDYLQELGDGMTPVAPIFAGESYLGKPKDGESFAEGEGAAWALAWYEEGERGGRELRQPDPDAVGGTHEAGLRAALFDAVKAFVDHHGLLPRGARLQAEDVVGEAALRPLRAHPRPAVPGAGQGEAHEPRRAEADRAGDPGPARGLAQCARRLRQAHCGARDPAGARADEVGAEGREEARARAWRCCRASSPTASPTTSSRREVFLVEGDSAGGSAKLARDKQYQAILPLRGKVLNTFEVDRDRLFANTEIHDIAVAIGVDPHRSAADADLARPALRAGSSSWRTRTSTAATSRSCC